MFSHPDFSDSDVSDQDVSPPDLLDRTFRLLTFWTWTFNSLTFWTRKFRSRTFWTWTLRTQVVPPQDFLDLDVSLPDVSDQVVSPLTFLVKDVLATCLFGPGRFAPWCFGPGRFASGLFGPGHFAPKTFRHRTFWTWTFCFRTFRPLIIVLLYKIQNSDLSSEYNLVRLNIIKIHVRCH